MQPGAICASDRFWNECLNLTLGDINACARAWKEHLRDIIDAGSQDRVFPFDADVGRGDLLLDCEALALRCPSPD